MLKKEYHWIIQILLLIFPIIVSTSGERFYSGTRYGKREDSGTKELSKYVSANRNGRSHSQVQVVARNDRFFLGTRYGKRNDCHLSTAADPCLKGIRFNEVLPERQDPLSVLTRREMLDLVPNRRVEEVRTGERRMDPVSSLLRYRIYQSLGDDDSMYDPVLSIGSSKSQPR